MQTLLLLSELEIKVIQSELLISCTTGTSIQELESLLTLPVDTVVLTKGYVDSVGFQRVCSFILSAKLLRSFQYIYLTTAFKADDFSKFLHRTFTDPYIIRRDIKLLTYEEFTAILEGKVVNSFTEKDYITIASNYTVISDFVEKIPKEEGQLLDSYLLSHQGDVLESIKVLNTLHYENQLYIGKLNEVLSKLEQQKADIKRYETQLSDARQSVRNLSEKLKHSVDYLAYYKNSIDLYNQLSNQSYLDIDNTYTTESNTIIIYFKELEDIQFYDIYQEIIYLLKNVYKFYVKSLILEAPNRIYYNRYSLDNYHKLLDTTSYKEVINWDLLVNYGNARAVLELLTKPEVKLDILVILDKQLNYRPAIVTDKTFTLLCGRNRANYDNLNIPDDIFLSTEEGFYVEDMKTFKGIQDKTYTGFSAHAITQRSQLFLNIISYIQQKRGDMEYV